MVCDECWTEHDKVVKLIVPNLNEGNLTLCIMCYGKYKQKLQENRYE